MHVLEHAYTHRKAVRDFIRIERRLLPSWAARPRRARPKPPATPRARRAAAILKAVLDRYEPGTRLSRSHIVTATGCGETDAVWVRDWAKSQGLWPYADSVGNGRKGGGS